MGGDSDAVAVGAVVGAGSGAVAVGAAVDAGLGAVAVGAVVGKVVDVAGCLGEIVTGTGVVVHEATAKTVKMTTAIIHVSKCLSIHDLMLAFSL